MERPPPPPPPRQPRRPRAEIAERNSLLSEFRVAHRRWRRLESAYQEAFEMSVLFPDEVALPSQFNLLAALRVLMKAEGLVVPRVFQFQFGASLSSEMKKKINELNVEAGYAPDSDVDSDDSWTPEDPEEGPAEAAAEPEDPQEGPAEAAAEPEAEPEASIDGVEGNAARRSRSRRRSRAPARRPRY